MPSVNGVSFLCMVIVFKLILKWDSKFIRVLLVISLYCSSNHSLVAKLFPALYQDILFHFFLNQAIALRCEKITFSNFIFEFI